MKETKKLTYSECIEVFNVINKIDLSTDTKLKHSVIKLLKGTKKIADEYSEKVSDINIEYCYADEKGIIQKDAQGGFVFQKEDLKKREKAIKDLNKEIVEIEIFNLPVTEELKKSINLYSIDLLRGILFEAEESTEDNG